MLPSFLGICHVGGGGGCPAYGTVLSNSNVTYPIAEGGAYFLHLGVQYPTQNCDVNTIADGSCGEIVDWSSASNISYKTNGTILGTVGNSLDGYFNYYYYVNLNAPYLINNAGSYWTLDSVDYYKQYYSQANILSDGVGGATFDYITPVYWPVAFIIKIHNNQTEVPTGSGIYYPNATDDVWDVDTNQTDLHYYLSGNYEPAGTLITEDITGSGGSVEVPTSSGNYFDSENTGHRYEWDGSGGYNDITTWYKPYGTYITTDGGTDYYWDGIGGYYS